METVQKAVPDLGRGETLWNYFAIQELKKKNAPLQTNLVHLGGLWFQSCISLEGKFRPQ